LFVTLAKRKSTAWAGTVFEPACVLHGNDGDNAITIQTNVYKNLQITDSNIVWTSLLLHGFFVASAQRRVLGKACSQTTDSVLVLFKQGAIAAQHTFLYLAEIFDRRWCATAGQYVQHVYPFVGYSGKVVSLWSAITAFIFALRVWLDTADFSKNTLREAEALSFFPKPGTNSTHLNA
jgi:hypothetical protein